jgi:TetR/AcrR family transcriptional regulator, transcriptional repressor for nem operon
MKQEQDTRQKLLATAVDLIWEHSYHSVSVDDICKRAGVLKGSFYHFFDSKSALTVAAYDEYWTVQRKPALDEAFSPDYPPVDRLLRYCDQVYGNQRRRWLKSGKVCGCPFSAIGSELSTQDEKIRLKSKEVGDRIRGRFVATLEEAMRDGSIEPGDPTVLARELYSLVTGILLQARIQDNLETVKDLKPAMIRLLGMKSATPAKAVGSRRVALSRAKQT